MLALNADNAAIRRAVNSSPGWKKADRTTLAANMQSMIAAGRVMLPQTIPAIRNSKPQAAWTTEVNAYLAAVQNLDGLLKDPATRQQDAKQAFKAVQNTCSRCHRMFPP